MGSHSLLQGIFPTQGLSPGLPHCRRILLPSEPPGKPKNTGVGSPSLLQGIFPTQESNQGLLHSLPAELPGKPNMDFTRLKSRCRQGCCFWGFQKRLSFFAFSTFYRLPAFLGLWLLPPSAKPAASTISLSLTLTFLPPFVICKLHSLLFNLSLV